MQTFNEFLAIHADDVATNIIKVVETHNYGLGSRIFNEMAYRGEIVTSREFIVTAKSSIHGKDSPLSLQEIPTLHQFFRNMLDKASKALFQINGDFSANLTSHPPIAEALTMLENSSMDNDRFKKQLIVSYCLSFVFAQATEMHVDAFIAEVNEEGEMDMSPALRAQNLITAALNEFANDPESIATRCFSIAARSFEELQRYFTHAQQCAKNSSSHLRKFYHASEMLYEAVNAVKDDSEAAADIYNMLMTCSPSANILGNSTQAITSLIHTFQQMKGKAPLHLTLLANCLLLVPTSGRDQSKKYTKIAKKLCDEITTQNDAERWKSRVRSGSGKALFRQALSSPSLRDLERKIEKTSCLAAWKSANDYIAEHGKRHSGLATQNYRKSIESQLAYEILSNNEAALAYYDQKEQRAEKTFHNTQSFSALPKKYAANRLFRQYSEGLITRLDKHKRRTGRSRSSDENGNERKLVIGFEPTTR